jgi:uncharacterized protein with PIN domain
VTRDTAVVRERHLPPLVFVTSDHFREQLRQVGAAVSLARGGAFTRCVECNDPLVTIAREAVRERVPPYVFETQHAFWTCPTCHRLYWPATHHARMRAELAAMGLEEAR